MGTSSIDADFGFNSLSFSICFTSEPLEYLDDDPSIPSAVGLITVGEFVENFVSTLYEWTNEQYQRQWRDSLVRFVNGADRAVLITWYVNRKESSNLQRWALYRGEAGIVHVQSHMPWYSNLDRQFAVDEASNFLQDRITLNEDRLALSEWNIPIGEIELFLGRLKKQTAPP
jgi:hypothetical protein